MQLQKSQLPVLKPGDTLHIPKNVVHAMWNHSDAGTVVNWKVQPAMNTENLLETVTGLAVDGKTNAYGKPALLQSVLVAHRFAPVVRLAKPSFAVQKIVFNLCTPFAHLLGYRPTYKQYLDEKEKTH